MTDVVVCSLLSQCVVFLMILRPPISTRTDTLSPYTTLFRSFGLFECIESGPVRAQPWFRSRYCRQEPGQSAGNHIVGRHAAALFVERGGAGGPNRSCRSGRSGAGRSEERRVGKEGVGTCRSRGSPSH